MARELCEDKSRSMVSSGSGFVYSDVVSSSNPSILVNHQIQGFDSNPEIFNLTTGMEMIGFSKQHHEFNKPDFATGISEASSDHHHHHQNLMVGGTTTGGPDHHHHQQHHSSAATAWQENGRQLLVDDSSLRCVFPCEPNERPSQGLSLSLCSANPSSIGLQSFELRHTTQDQQEMRFFTAKPSTPSSNFQQQQQQQHMLQPANFQLRNSKYLGPAQDLLNEFCSLGTKQSGDHNTPKHKNQKLHNKQQWEDENGSSSRSSSRKQPLHSLEFMELQKRKTKLLSMLEEVDKRYKHYCDQMKAVVSSFEAVAGNGAASVYSALASKAMSKHFRCLRDGIVAQIHATKKAMGEKDPVAPGTTRGETPRLRILDQTLRQQRAFQQMSMMETHPWRPQRGLPERSVSVLRAWLFEHFLHPYPSDVDKHILARQTGLSRSQVSNWFINARVRLWKPMVEEMYLEETKEHDNNMGSNSDGVTDLDDNNNNNNIDGRPNSSTDQKPTQDQLLRIDSECLSSIISNSDKNDTTKTAKSFQPHHLHNFGTYGTGAMELDFSSYNAAAGGVSYANEHQSFNAGGGGGSGVSLTLGLQQHGGSGGVSLAFSPASQSSLFYARDHIEDCQQAQYSLLDGDQGQNLPYRNLMGAQLLHDLAG